VSSYRQITDAETSNNASYALNFADDRFDLTFSANYTRIRNFAILDSGATDPVTGDPVTLVFARPNWKAYLSADGMPVAGS
jgi:hypothetical protein